jgi:hypothetical protein
MYGRPAIEITVGILTPMLPEARPDPQPGIPEPASAPLAARAASAEEEAAAARDWTIAPTPIPPDTTDAELVALWLHGKSPHTIRAYGDDVAAFRRFTGKPLRATYLSDLQRYADSLAKNAQRSKTVKVLSKATPMGHLALRSRPDSRSPGRHNAPRAHRCRFAQSARNQTRRPGGRAATHWEKCL